MPEDSGEEASQLIGIANDHLYNEEIKQSQSLVHKAIPQFGWYCECGYILSCAGLPNGAIRNNGVFLSEGRKGRRGKRHKNSTNLADGKLQPVPSETQIVEAGRSHSHECIRGKACTMYTHAYINLVNICGQI